MHKEIKSCDGFGVYEAEKLTDLSNTPQIIKTILADGAKISKLRLERKHKSRFVTEGFNVVGKRSEECNCAVCPG